MDINNVYQEVKKLNLDQKSKSLNYDKFCILIIKNKVIRPYQDLLDILFPNNKFNAKKLITSYLIKNYSNIILSKDKLPIEMDIYDISNKVIQNLLLECFDKEECINNIKKYYICFNKWIQQDKESLLVIANDNYQTIKEYQEHIVDFNPNIIPKMDRAITMIGGKKTLDAIKKNSKPNLASQILAGTVANTITYHFWNKFTLELNQEPPNFIQYPILLQTIREKILQVCNFKNNINTYLDKHINISIIKNKIKNNKYNLQQIYDQLVKIITITQDLSSKEREERFIFYHGKLKKLIVNKDNLSDIIPNVFKFILEELDYIILIKNNINK